MRRAVQNAVPHQKRNWNDIGNQEEKQTGAGRRSRTDNGENPQRILSPPRMPISPALHRLTRRSKNITPCAAFRILLRRSRSYLSQHGAAHERSRACVAPRLYFMGLSNEVNLMSRLFFAVIAVTLLASTPLMNRDQGDDSASAFQVVLENAYVRISQADIPRNVKTSYAASAGLSAVVIHLRHVYGLVGHPPTDPQPFEFDRVAFLKPGEVSNHVDAYPSGMREIHIELKAVPPASSFDKDAVVLDPLHNKVLFENNLVRVVEVHFGQLEKGPVVDKRPRVIILLNDMHADVARHEGDSPSARDGKAGVIQWSLGGSQATMNRNETILDNIVVEIKGK
jgi:hypothetical protein